MTNNYIALYFDVNDPNKFIVASSHAHFELISELMKRKYNEACSGCKKLLDNYDGNPKYAKMLYKIEELLNEAEMTIIEIIGLLRNYGGQHDYEIPYVYNEYCDERINEYINKIKMKNDKTLLKLLVEKYGKAGVMAAIDKLNESKNPGLITKLTKKLISLYGGDYNTIIDIANSGNINAFFDFWQDENIIDMCGKLTSGEIEYFYYNFDEAVRMAEDYYDQRMAGKYEDEIVIKRRPDFVPKTPAQHKRDIDAQKVKQFIIKYCGENCKSIPFNAFAEFIVQHDNCDYYDTYYHEFCYVTNGKYWITFHLNDMTLVGEQDKYGFTKRIYMNEETYKRLYDEYKRFKNNKE